MIMLSREVDHPSIFVGDLGEVGCRDSPLVTACSSVQLGPREAAFVDPPADGQFGASDYGGGFFDGVVAGFEEIRLVCSHSSSFA